MKAQLSFMRWQTAGALMAGMLAACPACGGAPVSAAPTTAPAAMQAAPSPRAVALGDDFGKSMAALRELAKSPGGGAFDDVVRQLAARDRQPSKQNHL